MKNDQDTRLNTAPIPVEPETKAPVPVETPKKEDTPTQQRLDEIRDILNKIADKLPDKKKEEKKPGDDNKDKKEKVDNPSLWRGLGDFTKALRNFARSPNISSALTNFRGMLSGSREAAGAVSNALLGHATLSGKEKKKTEESKKTTKEEKSTSVSTKLNDLTNRVVNSTVNKSTKNFQDTRLTLPKEVEYESGMVPPTNKVVNDTRLNTSTTKTTKESKDTRLASRVSSLTNNVVKNTLGKSAKAAADTRLAAGAARLALGGAGRAVGAVAGGAVAGPAGAAAGGVAGGVAGGAAGGAAAAAGGAGAAAMVATAASVIGVIGAVGAALAALPMLIKSWGESLLESQRKLADVSGSMAAVFAKKDVADTMRGQRIGEATAGSAGNLSDALIKLEDRFEPFIVIITNFLNDVMTGFVEFATGIMDAIIGALNTIIRGINKLIPGADVLKEIAVNTRKKDEDTDFGDVLRDWQRQSNDFKTGPARANPGVAIDRFNKF
jgi:hypothetical protein